VNSAGEIYASAEFGAFETSWVASLSRHEGIAAAILLESHVRLGKAHCSKRNLVLPHTLLIRAAISNYVKRPQSPPGRTVFSGRSSIAVVAGDALLTLGKSRPEMPASVCGETHKAETRCNVEEMAG